MINMYVAIIAVVVLLLFTVWLISSFFVDILELIINLVVLYAICVRGYIEIEREKKQYYYLIGFVITALFFLVTKQDIFSKVFHVWKPVFFLAIVFLIAQLAFIFHSFYTGKYKK